MDSANGGNVTRLTTIGTYNGQPAYKPDGDRIVFSSNDPGPFKLLVMDRTGHGITAVTSGTRDDYVPDWR